MHLSLATAEQDFGAAYDTYADAIFRHCLFRCFDRERGKELMQETFMKVWEYVAGGREIENVQAFLYRIANNLLIDEARRVKRRPKVSLDQLQEAGFDVGSDADANAMKNRVDERMVLEVLEQMDEQHRTVVILRYIDGMKPAEIAEALNVTPNVVSVRLSRGMEKLRSLLGDDA